MKETSAFHHSLACVSSSIRKVLLLVMLTVSAANAVAANDYKQQKQAIMQRIEETIKHIDQIQERLYFKQPTDTGRLFNLTLQLFENSWQLDSLQNAVKKSSHSLPRKLLLQLDKHKENLYYGGSFFSERKKWDKSLTFFRAYLMASPDGKHFSEAAYRAFYSAYKLRKTETAMRYAPLALIDSAHAPLVLQTLAEMYREQKDTANYLQTLEDGLTKYPQNHYFSHHLIGWQVDNDRLEDALKTADYALDKDKNNTTLRLTKAQLLLKTKRYDDCIALCDTLTAASDSLAPVHLYAGLAYYNKGVGMVSTDRHAAVALYEQSLRHMETYRRLMPNDTMTWAKPLYMIYLELNAGDKFDEINRIIHDVLSKDMPKNTAAQSSKRRRTSGRNTR